MNKIELIDRTEVIEALEFSKTIRHMQANVPLIDEFIGILKDAPTIDAAPVRRGEWVMVDEYCNHAKTYECTACRGVVELDRYTRCCDYDFCPNCGAEMS